MDLDSALTGKPAEGAGATELLRADHREVSRLFAEYEHARGAGHARKVLAQTIAMQLELHDAVERDVFYPAVKALERAGIEAALRDHDDIARVTEALREGTDDSARHDEHVATLKRLVDQHVREEEEGLFPRVEQNGAVSLRELGAKMVKRKEELTRSTESFEGPAT